MGLIRIGKFNTIQNTNGFIYCAQFCNYNRNVITAVGGNIAKFYSS